MARRICHLLEPRVLDVQVADRAKYDWKEAITEEQDGIVLVVQEDEHLLGVASIAAAPSGSDQIPWVHMFYVLPRAWGTGAAMALLHAVVAEVRTVGRSVIGLTVAEPQMRARRFYEREGWTWDRSAAPRSNGLCSLLTYRKELAS